MKKIIALVCITIAAPLYGEVQPNPPKIKFTIIDYVPQSRIPYFLQLMRRARRALQWNS